MKESIVEERVRKAEEADMNREVNIGKVMKLWNEGYRKHVIAEQLGIPESTVRSIIQETNMKKKQ